MILLTPSENWMLASFEAKLQPNFTLGEVCNYQRERLKNMSLQNKRNAIELAYELQAIRNSWKKGAIIVTSWFRDSETNRRVGGVANSQHLTGGAVDIYPAYGSGLDFEKFLDEIAWKDKHLGLGQVSGRGFTHLDLRPGRVRWRY